MRILVTGAAGFLGTRLARTLLAGGPISLAGAPAQAITALRLTDLFAPPADLAADPRVQAVTGDLGTLLAEGRLRLDDVDAVVHLASAVSADCEADLDLGLRSNLAGSLALLQAARQGGIASGRPPVFVFASSVAVFGAAPGHALPALIEDEHLPTPQGSYGIQKFMVEQLVADFSRRGLVQGRTVRLMTVAVRPGRPNGAASSFVSGMLREPLAGQRCTVPVAPETAVALASPGRTVAGLLAALSTPAATWGPPTAVNLPALTTTVGEMARTLAALAGPEAAARLDWVPDARITAIVGGWPARIAATRAAGLGLQPDASVAELLRAYAADHPEALAQPLRA
ncbi:NAD-dependent epimerase/dehydratase family protein [Ideonella livida]|uniref:NAD-dependent epimerase/dehydratase family protein n=1 Tax=Ideonella livida TaxID=2707176 RepID=A0A7C9PFD0_9BURK|nr:NAD-dependent epimerase/dehydratase family protein [Ideonella livida]NDY90435.1 NAD-dependent epimerase/dehydratase family protein [Ideonella livida]